MTKPTISEILAEARRLDAAAKIEWDIMPDMTAVKLGRFARTALPALVEEVERLQAKVELMRSEAQSVVDAIADVAGIPESEGDDVS